MQKCILVGLLIFTLFFYSCEKDKGVNVVTGPVTFTVSPVDYDTTRYHEFYLHCGNPYVYFYPGGAGKKAEVSNFTAAAQSYIR